MAMAVVGALVLSFATQVAAQNQVDGQPDVMDRAVSDIDPMAANLRYVDTEMQAAGTMTRLQTPFASFAKQGTVYIDPATGLSGRTRPYKLEGQGFTAYLHRPLYMVSKERWEKVRGEKQNARTDYAPRKDGEWLALIPPDTVYDLHPVPVMTPEEVLAHVARRQLNEGQTNEEVGNIPTNPFFIPTEAQQVETRVNSQIMPRMVNRRINPKEMDSQFELQGAPGSRLQHELAHKAFNDQANVDRMFQARKEKWLEMKRQMAAEREQASQEHKDEVVTIATDSPKRIQERVEEIEREMEREAKDREKFEAQRNQR